MRKVCCWSGCATTVRRFLDPLQRRSLGRQVAVVASGSFHRHCSSNSNTATAGTNVPSVASPPSAPLPPRSSGEPCAESSSPNFSSAALNDELKHILHGPLPVGTTFQRLSKPAQSFLSSQKIGLEQHLLREPDLFRVFQEPGSRTIMACRKHHMPIHALRGVEATPDRIFSGAKDKTTMDHITTVLKYIPNEWSSFTDLGVPESIRVNVMNRKAKAWLEKHPQYFEVQSQSVVAHTFQVRRALSLQRKLDESQLRSSGDVTRTHE